MRLTRNYVLLSLWVAAFFLGSSAAGQQRITVAKATIPFDYWIGGKKFPAGDYILDSSVPTFVTLRSKDGSVNEEVPTILYGDPVEKKDARLLFVNRNGKYYLKELRGVLGKRTVTSEYGIAVPKEGGREVALTYP
jgi:hypothetical protein